MECRRFASSTKILYAAFIHPGAVDTKEMQGYLKILHSVFHLFTVFSAFEKVGQRFQVQSRIIASSVQPPVEKLVEPVVIVFGGVKVTILARVKFIPFWAMPIEK